MQNFSRGRQIALLDQNDQIGEMGRADPRCMYVAGLIDRHQAKKTCRKIHRQDIKTDTKLERHADKLKDITQRQT